MKCGCHSVIIFTQVMSTTSSWRREKKWYLRDCVWQIGNMMSTFSPFHRVMWQSSSFIMLVSSSDINIIFFVNPDIKSWNLIKKIGYRFIGSSLDGGDATSLQFLAVSWESETRSHYTSWHLIADKMSGWVSEAMTCWTKHSIDADGDHWVWAWVIHYFHTATAYFRGHDDRCYVFIHHLLHQHAIFGSLKSGYRFVQTIYRLSYMILHHYLEIYIICILLMFLILACHFQLRLCDQSYIITAGTDIL